MCHATSVFFFRYHCCVENVTLVISRYEAVFVENLNMSSKRIYFQWDNDIPFWKSTELFFIELPITIYFIACLYEIINYVIFIIYYSVIIVSSIITQNTHSEACIVFYLFFYI